jgi:hypothetical protein
MGPNPTKIGRALHQSGHVTDSALHNLRFSSPGKVIPPQILANIIP